MCEITCAEHLIMKSSVTKHYGCKCVRHCGPTSSGHSQGNEVRNMNCYFTCFTRYTAIRSRATDGVAYNNGIFVNFLVFVFLLQLPQRSKMNVERTTLLCTGHLLCLIILASRTDLLLELAEPGLVKSFTGPEKVHRNIILHCWYWWYDRVLSIFPTWFLQKFHLLPSFL